MNLLYSNVKYNVFTIRQQQPVPELFPFYLQVYSSEWQVTRSEIQLNAAVYREQHYDSSALDCE